MPQTQKRVGIFTLGCKVNQYESEAIAERLTDLGLTVVSPSEKCDAYVINTCAVTNIGERKSRQIIRRAKKQNPDGNHCNQITVNNPLRITNRMNVENNIAVTQICSQKSNSKEAPSHITPIYQHKSGNTSQHNGKILRNETIIFPIPAKLAQKTEQILQDGRIFGLIFYN